MRFKVLVAALLALQAVAVAALEDDDYGSGRWQELETSLPGAPLAENLQEFVVSATTTNRFFVDLASLSAGDDGVVRYVLVIDSASGVRNVSFEGMRCETRERKVYALGRSDGSWAPSRNKAWSKILDAVTNRHYASLYLNFFCPMGGVVKSADEARDALRKGVHPMMKFF